MIGATDRELLARAASALRRAAMWWGLGIVLFAVVSAAFWPSLEDSEALAGFEEMGALLEAFGAQDIATPAGYLDGQLYALMLPLLLSGFAIAGVTALTSGDEQAGRLEFLHALPVSRTAVWLTRWIAAMLLLGAVTVATAVVMVVSLPVFSLDEAGVGRVVGATFGCALLAAFHGAVGYAAAGFGATRAASAGLAIAVLVSGYVLSFLVPLVAGLRSARRASPWYWALGEQPVSDGIPGAWPLVLVAVTAALVAVGTWAVEHRDIRPG
jgi:ABC-2 type transport system permease protein